MDFTTGRQGWTGKDDTVYELSANIELMFAEAGVEPEDRVKAAADQGFTAVEIWSSSNKDLPQLAKALSQTGTRLVTMVVEPRLQLAVEETHAEFLGGVAMTLERARELGCDRIVVTSGLGIPNTPRARQIDILVGVLSRAAELLEDTSVNLLLENLNTKVDHPGVLVDSTAECLEIVRAVSSPHFALLYDLYHSITMGEKPREVLAGSIDLVSHVQIADSPGRGAPGTGTIDFGKEFAGLRRLGYAGVVGLEYYPVEGGSDTKTDTEYIRDVARNS